MVSAEIEYEGRIITEKNNKKLMMKNPPSD